MARKQRRAAGKRPVRPVSEPETEENPESLLYDEVERFHELKTKIPLATGRRVSDSESEEEVLDVRSTDEDEEDGDNGGEAIADPEEMNDSSAASTSASSESDEDEQDESVEDWGGKKSDFYNTDFQGDEHVGFNESDEEAAQLEETQAISMQKRLLMMTTDQDYGLDEAFATPAAPSENRLMTQKDDPAKLLDEEHKSTKIARRRHDQLRKQKETVAERLVSSAESLKTDLSNLSEDKKLELLEMKSPELLVLVGEFKKEANFITQVLLPAVHEPGTETEDLVGANARTLTARFSFQAHMNFLMNVAFYLSLKAHRVDCTNHPVYDRLMKWREFLTRTRSSYEEVVTYFERVIAENSNSTARKRLRSKAAQQHNVSSKQVKQKRTDYLLDEDSAMNEPEEKRAITFEMAKNRGVLPKRKKEVRNPRVKYRNRYHKALVRRRSQIPDVKFEMERYGGEARGINPSLVRSVKLS